MIAAAQLETTAPDPLATVLVLRRMVSAGFSLTVESDGLVVTPASRLSDPQRACFRAHKAALVELLRDTAVLHRALLVAGSVGLDWREGTPDNWSDNRLLAVGEVLYRDGRMVNRRGRRYARISPSSNVANPDPPATSLPRKPKPEPAPDPPSAETARIAELIEQGWSPWNAKARAESERLPGWRGGHERRCSDL